MIKLFAFWFWSSFNSSNWTKIEVTRSLKKLGQNRNDIYASRDYLLHFLHCIKKYTTVSFGDFITMTFSFTANKACPWKVCDGNSISLTAQKLVISESWLKEVRRLQQIQCHPTKKVFKNGLFVVNDYTYFCISFYTRLYTGIIYILYRPKIMYERLYFRNR